MQGLPPQQGGGMQQNQLAMLRRQQPMSQ
jgi:hypothetical protein